MQVAVSAAIVFILCVSGFHRFGAVQIDTLNSSNCSLPFDKERLLLRRLFGLETLENLAALAKEPQHCLL